MPDKEKDSVSIKSWASEDQPRYKLLHKGAGSLSDSELLAILIRSGSTKESALELAKRILKSYAYDFSALGKLEANDLMKFSGIGEAKAITIMASLELGRRRQLTDIKAKPKITDSQSAYEAIAPLLMDKHREEFWLLLLNRSNLLLHRTCISQGGVSGTVVDAKLVFKSALDYLASGIILCHNHPSGQLNPSQADISLTRKLEAAGNVMDIKVLDHLIIGQQNYLSFADENLMGLKS
jgi:DNA repair protein RadC